MKQLDPKAVWLFFISGISRALIAMIFLGGWLFVPVVAGISILFGVSENNFGVVVVVGIITAIIFIIIALLIAYIYARLSYRFFRYELSDICFKKEYGIIWKKYVTIPYDRIQNVDVYRGVFARLLGLSDLQIQTAGGITQGSYGAFSEGRLPGISQADAEKLRDELIMKARSSKQQGL